VSLPFISLALRCDASLSDVLNPNAALRVAWIAWPGSLFKWQGARNVLWGELFANAAVSVNWLSRKLRVESGRRPHTLPSWNPADAISRTSCCADSLRSLGSISVIFTYWPTRVRFALLEAKEVSSRQSAWEQFSQDKSPQRLHKVADDETELLASVARMGGDKVAARVHLYR